MTYVLVFQALVLLCESALVSQLRRLCHAASLAVSESIWSSAPLVLQFNICLRLHLMTGARKTMVIRSKMDHNKVMTELKILQQEMLNLNESLQEFSDGVSAENYKVFDQIVDGSVTNLGTSANVTVPKMYQVKSLFGRMKCLAITHNLFSEKDIKSIEAKLGRKLDKFDTIHVRRPNEAGLQGLIIIHLVKLSDIAHHKL